MKNNNFFCSYIYFSLLLVLQEKHCYHSTSFFRVSIESLVCTLYEMSLVETMLNQESNGKYHCDKAHKIRRQVASEVVQITCGWKFKCTNDYHSKIIFVLIACE